MGVIRDLSGERFGRLTVLHFVGLGKGNKAVWHCRCDCGKEIDTIGWYLVSGDKSSCGCLKSQMVSKKSRIDLSGMKFERLTVLRSAGVNKHQQQIWHCVCECGKTVVVQGGCLTSGNTKSCGCYNRDMITTNGGLSKTKEYEVARVVRRKELERKLDSKWTTEMEMALREFFPMCIIDYSTDRLETDHVYPISRDYGLRPGNAVRLCKRCNSRKGNRLPDKLPKTMPKDAGDKLISAANEFKNYWESQFIQVTHNGHIEGTPRI